MLDPIQDMINELFFGFGSHMFESYVLEIVRKMEPKFLITTELSSNRDSSLSESLYHFDRALGFVELAGFSKISQVDVVLIVKGSVIEQLSYILKSTVFTSKNRIVSRKIIESI